MNSVKHIIALTLVAVCSWGCTGNFAEINRNKDQATKEEMDRENYIIGATIKGMQGLVVPAQEHLHQFVNALSASAFAGYMEFNAVRTTKFSTFNPTQDWVSPVFNDMISQTYPNYRDIYNKTDDPVALAMADVLRVAIMHGVTDAFGPIPYSKIVEDKKESLAVAYDTQKQVYDKMFEELTAAADVFAGNLHIDAAKFAKFDNVFYGNIAQWMRYTNSLKLRMAMRISYVEPDRAKTLAEEAVAGGVIEQNADNAHMHTDDNRTVLLYRDWQDYGVGADIICFMNGYADPRREKMFTKVTKGSGTAAVSDFYGMRIGIHATDKGAMMAAYSAPVVKNDDPLNWMNAAEVTFLRAEGALRGWAMGGDAKTLYNSAIALSFEERGATGADTYVESTATPLPYTDPLYTYSYNTPASSITVKWNDSATAFEENLERIITQKWIAIFPLGPEAWAEYRRTGYPRLIPVATNNSGNTVDSATGARRMPYPADEYTENGANVQAAVGMLGGADNFGTRLWWDAKNN
jgi:hypothetical protein